MILLNEQDIFPAQVRAISDGDPSNASFTNMAPQDLANRTRFLHNTLEQGGLKREGATKIREVADEAALRALAGMADGELAITKNNGLVFRYAAVAVGSEIARWIVTPNSGPGRWLNTAFSLLGGPRGLVWMDQDERIPATMPKNGVVAIRSVGMVSELIATDSYEYSANGRVSLGELRVGDVVDVSATAMVSLKQSDAAEVKLALFREGAIVTYDPSEYVLPGCSLPATVGHVASLGGRFTVKDGGAHEVAVGRRLTAPGDAWAIACAVRATVYRP